MSLVCLVLAPLNNLIWPVRVPLFTAVGIMIRIFRDPEIDTQILKGGGTSDFQLQTVELQYPHYGTKKLIFF